MYNVYIIQSPLQFISAIEASYYYKNDSNILIIRYANEEVTNFQIDAILELYKSWSKVFVVPSHKYNLVTGIKTISLIKKILRKLGKPARIFIGDYRSWYTPYLLRAKFANQYYLMDDGNSTIDIQSNYLSKRKLYFGDGIKGIVKSTIFYFVSRRFSGEKFNVNIFTSFNLEPVFDGQTVIGHDFEYLRWISVDKKFDETSIYFFGAPISELKLLPIDREIEILGRIRDFYKDRNIKIIYIPHRRESSDKLKIIKGALQVKVVYFKHCAEIELVLSKVIPFGIASFYSTTLHTLPKIFDFKLIESHKLPIDEVPLFYRSGLNSVYAEYEKCMCVVDILAR